MIDLLISKKAISQNELDRKEAEVAKSLRPMGFLTGDEVGQLEEKLRSLDLPAPRIFREAMAINSLKSIIESFDPAEPLRDCQLSMLRSVVEASGADKKTVRLHKP